jgi:hypothetical protein
MLTNCDGRPGMTGDAVMTRARQCPCSQRDLTTGTSAEPNLEHHRLAQRHAGQLLEQTVVLLDLLEEAVEFRPSARLSPVQLEQLQALVELAPKGQSTRNGGAHPRGASRLGHHPFPSGVVCESQLERLLSSRSQTCV